MPTPKGYTDQTTIEAYMMKSVPTAIVGKLNNIICAVEKIIDGITGRNFKADAAASARVYDGDDTSEILIDDCTEITKVEVGNDETGESFTEVASTGSDKYVKYPQNYSVKGLPIDKLVLTARIFLEGLQNNRITAKWGYCTTPPDDIGFAATIFAAGIINQLSQGGGEIKTERIGNYSVTYNSEVGNNSWADFEKAKEALEKYVKLML